MESETNVTAVGTYRHLTQCSTPAGHFVILAIDHRANLKARLDAAASQPLTDEAFADFKMQVVRALLPQASAVLIDPEYGVARGIATGAIGGQQGLLAPLEVTDYDLHPSQRSMRFIEGWSVDQIKLAGGSGVKLLLTYHPDSADAAAKRDFVERIAADCQRNQIPFFLEPIAYALDPAQKLSSAEKRRVVIESAATFTAQVDVLKVEFPALPSDDESTWESALRELDDACGTTPWALLSAGVDFETFVRQATMACEAGSSGVMVGRAVWAEATSLHGAALDEFLTTTARPRMAQLAQVCAESAVDWRTKTPPLSFGLDWFRTEA